MQEILISKDLRRAICFTVAECVIRWKAKLEYTVSLLTKVAKYMAAVEASKEALWLRRLVETFSII